MLERLWNVGIKVPDLERELEFHRAGGNEIVLDEELTDDDESYRLALVKMGDKYLHLGERMVYEAHLDAPLPYGPVHVIYICDDFEADVERQIAAGATLFLGPLEATAGFGHRKGAFFRTPSGWVLEIAKIYRHDVPEV